MIAIDWVIVFALNASVIGYGFYLARGTKSSGEWFFAGRALPWWAIGLSMFATNIDNADIVSLAGKTYKEGLHIMTVHALGSTIGCILAAFLLVPTMRRLGHYTNAEYLEERFGVSARVLSALIQIQYRTSMLGLIIWAVFLLLTKRLIGLDEQVAWGVIVAMVILAGVYTSWGGLRSVVWTDTLQGIIMMAGSLVILIAVWNAVGGWSGMTTRLDDAGAGSLATISGYRGATGATTPWVIALGWVIIGSGYWTVNHTQTMRLGGARSLWDMKMAALFGVALSFPLMLACGALGLFGRALSPDLARPDEIYPLLASQHLGAGLTGLVVAGIFAAAVSTFDSLLTRVHRRSGVIGLCVGSLYGIIALYDRETPDVTWLPLWLTEKWEALGWSLLITTASMILATAFLGLEERVDKAAGSEAPIREHPFKDRVPALLNPLLYAAALLGVSAYLVFGLFW